MNKLEKIVHDTYRKDGWKVLRNGWPDFLIVRGDDMFGVEVKGQHDDFRASQRKMLTVLQSRIPILTALEGPNYYDDPTDPFHAKPLELQTPSKDWTQHIKTWESFRRFQEIQIEMRGSRP